MSFLRVLCFIVALFFAFCIAYDSEQYSTNAEVDEIVANRLDQEKVEIPIERELVSESDGFTFRDRLGRRESGKKQFEFIFCWYYFNNNINLYLGDRLVHQFHNQIKSRNPTDFRFNNLRYNGSVISYVEVIVKQTSDLGRVNLVDGGIGSKTIQFTVMAENITEFNYVASIYGH